MRYYVEINGESSLDIQGLMIQSLPSISKPLMRSKQETIDGRNGDIVTKLGYSAYDKTLKIGLWGNYDINEVIAFFNQEGEIVFSNEPDKYYRFTILNRDDYVSQLDKFRTCTIALHCQPYKYKLNEEAEEIENEYVEQEGTSLTFNNTLVVPMNIDLKGNTLQNGTPTPSSPIPINNVSGDNDIVVSDGASDTTTYNIDLPVENLIYTGSITRSGITFEYDSITGITTFSGKPDMTYAIADLINSNIPAGTYTLSLETPKSVGVGIGIRIDGGNRVAYPIPANTKSITITTTGTITSYDVYITTLDTNTTYNDSFKLQLEKGNQVNSFTPYGTTPIELNKIGTYQDYIYKDNDKWYLHKETIKIELNQNTEGWITDTIPSGNPRHYITQTTHNYDIKTPPNNDTSVEGYANVGIVSATDTARGTNNGVAVHPNGSIYCNNGTYNNLSNVPIILEVVLNTPTNTEITYTPLIEQLDELENAKSKEGTTNVNQINNDAPFIITASVLSGTDSITLTNEGNTTSKPTLTITGSGVVGVYLENIQMFNISLGTNETIIIDTENMEAYYGSQLKNRQVTGDYSNFALQSGTNNLKFTGLVTNVEITNYNRWI